MGIGLTNLVPFQVHVHQGLIQGGAGGANGTQGFQLPPQANHNTILHPSPALANCATPPPQVSVTINIAPSKTCV